MLQEKSLLILPSILTSEDNSRGVAFALSDKAGGASEPARPYAPSAVRRTYYVRSLGLVFSAHGQGRDGRDA